MNLGRIMPKISVTDTEPTDAKSGDVLIKKNGDIYQYNGTTWGNAIANFKGEDSVELGLYTNGVVAKYNTFTNDDYLKLRSENGFKKVVVSWIKDTTNSSEYLYRTSFEALEDGDYWYFENENLKLKVPYKDSLADVTFTIEEKSSSGGGTQLYEHIINLSDSRFNGVDDLKYNINFTCVNNNQNQMTREEALVELKKRKTFTFFNNKTLYFCYFDDNCFFGYPYNSTDVYDVNYIITTSFNGSQNAKYFTDTVTAL